MAHIVTGTFDGHVMQFDDPPPFPANTRLIGTLEQEDSALGAARPSCAATARDLNAEQVTSERESVDDTTEHTQTAPTSFFDVARSIQIEGPPDWSERLDHYLYGGMVDDGE
jgi:hypothetical protein